MSKATGTYPAYVAASPPPSAPAPSASASAPQAVINSQGQNLPPSSDQFQAAKYFTFVFFGLSVFVIVLFAGYVLVHCYRRICNGPPQPDPADAEVGRAVEAKVVPMREGFMVTNPDGGLEVAYVSDTPRVSPKPGSGGSAAGPSGGVAQQTAAGRADVTRAAAGDAAPPGVAVAQTGRPGSAVGEVSLAGRPGASGAR